MFEVKTTGRYKCRGGRVVRVYAFDELTGHRYAEGFFEDNRHMAHWNPEGGQYVWGRATDPDFDITERLEDERPKNKRKKEVEPRRD